MKQMDKKERREREKAEAAEKRRRQILDAGKKLFAERSPGEVTMTAIAAECGLSKATIYLYYGSKEELLFHIMTEFIHWGISQFKMSPELTGMENLQKLIWMLKEDYTKNLPMKNLIGHFDFYYENEYPELPVVAEFESKAHELNDQLTRLIEAGQRDKSVRADINPRIYACLIGNFSSTFGSRTALRRKLLTKNQKADPYEEYCLALDLILESLRNRSLSAYAGESGGREAKVFDGEEKIR